MCTDNSNIEPVLRHREAGSSGCFPELDFLQLVQTTGFSKLAKLCQRSSSFFFAWLAEQLERSNRSLTHYCLVPLPVRLVAWSALEWVVRSGGFSGPVGRGQSLQGWKVFLFDRSSRV